MNVNECSKGPELSPAAVTEAAAWIARLHGPYRTPAVERGFRNWLNENSDHARAIELVTESWDEVAALKSGANIDITLPSDKPERKPKVRFIAAALAAAVAIVAIAGVIFHLHSSVVTTGVGEQRVLVLEDGTRVHLNTSTRVLVQYDEKKRHVKLQSGEALFQVAKRTHWPFVVTVGDHEVTALGTAFLVRRDEQRITVTLVEGKVTVLPAAAELSPLVPIQVLDSDELEKIEIESSRSPRGDEGQGLGAGEAAANNANAQPIVLSPGERLTFAGSGSPKLDRPVVNKLTAWQRGKVVMENLSLLDAIAEMNRYSTVQLVIEHPEAAQLRVSGIFRAGDSMSFARAVSQSYGVKVEEGSQRILLSDLPQLSF